MCNIRNYDSVYNFGFTTMIWQNTPLFSNLPTSLTVLFLEPTRHFTEFIHIYCTSLFYYLNKSFILDLLTCAYRHHVKLLPLGQYSLGHN